MNNKNVKKSLESLLISLELIKPDLAKCNGNPVEALAEQVIKRVNLIFDNKELFSKDFISKLFEYGVKYEKARKNTTKKTDLPKYIKPTNDLILNTVKDMLNKL